MRVATVCIAKNEDRYIDEWVQYNLLLGVDQVVVYMNDWTYDFSAYGGRVLAIDAPGEAMQFKAYNHFLRRLSGGYDFALVFDADEYLVLRRHENVKDLLAEYEDYQSVAFNWRLFGDSGLAAPAGEQYSCLGRFVTCERGLNRHVKVAVNCGKLDGRQFFCNPHCLSGSLRGENVTIDPTKTRYVYGPFNEGADVESAPAYIAHYRSKTRQEWIDNKIPKGKADFAKTDPCYYGYSNMQEFEDSNLNEVTDTSALDFFRKALARKIAE